MGCWLASQRDCLVSGSGLPRREGERRGRPRGLPGGRFRRVQYRRGRRAGSGAPVALLGVLVVDVDGAAFKTYIRSVYREGRRVNSHPSFSWTRSQYGDAWLGGD